MTDPNAPLIPLSRVPRYIRAPSPPHLNTVVRWATRGVGSPPVKLATVKVGGRRYTTSKAIAAFVAATSGRSTEPPAGRADRRRAEVSRAEHELDADGIR